MWSLPHTRIISVLLAAAARILVLDYIELCNNVSTSNSRMTKKNKKKRLHTLDYNPNFPTDIFANKWIASDGTDKIECTAVKI